MRPPIPKVDNCGAKSLILAGQESGTPSLDPQTSNPKPQTGERHPLVATTLGNLARVWEQFGDFVQVEFTPFKANILTAMWQFPANRSNGVLLGDV